MHKRNHDDREQRGAREPMDRHQHGIRERIKPPEPSFGRHEAEDAELNDLEMDRDQGAGREQSRDSGRRYE
jgi:hypothetical protein